jgi:3-oxoacid CoA-transferase subunit A
MPVIDKVYPSPATAVADLTSGMSLAVGGFGLCGIPSQLIHAVHRLGIDELDVVSNNCGVDDWGLGILLADRRISRVRGSYVGENKEFARQYLAGELTVELVPQGTLAERLRAGGSGIPAFYTPAGVGTPVADGGLPYRYTPDGAIALASPAKEVRRFGAAEYVLEEAITCDVALVHASWGDRHGNLVFRGAARNFNPLCAMAGTLTIAEVEQLFEPGDLDPDEIMLPGIFVQRVVLAEPTDPRSAKRIEKRTVRDAEAAR